MAMSKYLVIAAGIAVVGGGALTLALRNAPSSDARGSKSASAADVAAPSHAAAQQATPEIAANLAKARALTEPGARRESLVQVLSEAAEREPASTARLAMSLTTAEGRDEALHESVGHYLSADPEGARAWLNELVAREDAELNLVLAQAAARHDSKLGLELARRVHEVLRAPLLEEVFANWAGSDPQTASAEAAKLENPKDRRAAGAGAVSTWAQSDPHAALSWAAALQPESVRRPVLESLVTTWSENDPAAAARAAIEAQSSSRQRLLDTAVSAWATRDVDAAFGWLEGLSDAEARDGAATAALLTLVQTKPADAASRAVTWAAREAGASSSDVLDKVLSAFRARDPELAAEWQRTHGAR
jgi:hypothetical protein